MKAERLAARAEALEATRAKAGLPSGALAKPKAEKKEAAENTSPSGTMLTKSASAAKREGAARKGELLSSTRAKALAAAAL